MRLAKETADRLRTLTMEFILDVRSIYLRESGRTVVMKHWDHLASAVRIATRTASGPEEWATMVTRHLHLPSLSSSACRGLLDLTEYVHEHNLTEAWFELLTRESGHVMALARSTSDAQQEAKAMAEAERVRLAKARAAECEEERRLAVIDGAQWEAEQAAKAAGGDHVEATAS